MFEHPFLHAALFLALGVTLGPDLTLRNIGDCGMTKSGQVGWSDVKVGLLSEPGGKLYSFLTKLLAREDAAPAAIGNHSVTQSRRSCLRMESAREAEPSRASDTRA